MVLDGVFGKENFVNEIAWKRTTTKNDYKQGAFNWPRIHDVIFYYAKSVAAKPPFTQPFAQYSDEYISVNRAIPLATTHTTGCGFIVSGRCLTG